MSRLYVEIMSGDVTPVTYIQEKWIICVTGGKNV